MGTTRRKLFTALTALLMFGAFSSGFAADWISFDGSPETVQNTRVISSDGSATILEIELSGMFLESVVVDGEVFHSLQLHDFGSTQQIGAPALPIVADMIAIPGMSNVRVSILSEETITLQGYNVSPFQTPTTDDMPAGAFDYDEELYNTNTFLPEVRTELGEIGIMRDLRVVPLRVTPFSYNPVTEELIVSTRMVVKLEYYGISNEAVNPQQVTEVTPTIAKWYRSTVANFDELNIRENRQTDEFQVKYLFICIEEAVDIIQPLVDFRNAQGYGTEVRLREQGFASAEQFRDYIHDLYVSDGLEYVMLVGDWCQATGHLVMPMHMWSNTWSDSWYTMIDPWPNTGNDYLADIAIGRIIYDNIAELQLQIDKTMGYLLEPSTADNWAEHTLLVAHSEQYPLKYTQCKEQIRTYQYALQIPEFGTAYGGAGATNADVINYLNSNGSGILNYRGHGSQTEWWNWGPSGGFGNDEIVQLTNEDKLFVHFDVCCDNMDFPDYNGNCFAESFMKHDYGCVAIHSAIVPSYTIPNHDYDKEYYKAIYDLGIAGIGYQSNFANITVYNVHGSIGQSNIRTYLWLGDSAIDPWTNTPQQLTVNHLPALFLGASSMDLSVSIGGSPVEDAMVCANNAETYSVGWTDASGSLTLNFDGTLTQTGEMEFTVTCHNGIPYQVNVPVIQATGPYLTCTEVEVDDGIGNNNGMLNADEDANLSLTITNIGVANAPNVVVTLTSEDDYVTIIDGTENYGTINIGASGYVENGFEISVDANAPAEHNIQFTVESVTGVNSYTSNISVMVYPELTVTLTPTTTPIIIPAGGGMFEYNILPGNAGVTTAVGDVWIDAVLPGGRVTEALLIRYDLSLAGGGSLSRNLVQNVPGGAPGGTYEYRAFYGYYPDLVIGEDMFEFEKTGTDGSSSQNGWTLTGWDESENLTAGAAIPSDYFLAQNHPNPFNPETTITFGIPEAGQVKLTVYNIMGQKVATVFDGNLNAGQHQMVWNAAEMSTGIYFYQLTSGEFTSIKKCILMK